MRLSANQPAKVFRALLSGSLKPRAITHKRSIRSLSRNRYCRVAGLYKMPLIGTGCRRCLSRGVRRRWLERSRGTRHRLGSLLLGYYTPDGRLSYAGRVGTGMSDNELERLWQKLQPLALDKMPLAEAPPRGSRFGTPLVLSRVRWVRPEMVVEVSYLTWTEDSLLRQVVYLGEREDKPAAAVGRNGP